MARRHPKRRMQNGEHYAMLPVEVLESAALTTLPCFCHRLLTAIAAQYRGNNNGDLAMSWVVVQRYGINRKEHLVAGLASLLGRGLIQKTRQGGKRPMGPCLYAVTWKPIDACGGKLEIGPTTAASNAWAKWVQPAPAKQNNGTDGGPDSGPMVVPMASVSGPTVVPTAQFIGTNGGPPSRSPREGTDLSRAATTARAQRRHLKNGA